MGLSSFHFARPQIASVSHFPESSLLAAHCSASQPSKQLDRLVLRNPHLVTGYLPCQVVSQEIKMKRLFVAARRAKSFNTPRAASRPLGGIRPVSSTSSAANNSNTRARVYLAAGLIVGASLGIVFLDPVYAARQSQAGPRWQVTDNAPKARRQYADMHTMLIVSVVFFKSHDSGSFNLGPLP